jgi:putative SOS response-associated peptidase YedK
LCGRFLLENSLEHLKEHYNIKNEVQFKIGEIYPSDAPIILDKTGFKSVKWGFPMNDKLIINGRCETIFEKPMFSKAMEESRCIIPANSFYEWKDGKKYTIKIEGAELFSIGGITKNFILKDGTMEERFLILTTEANEDMKKIHHRMPLIIEKSLENIFLQEKTSREQLMDILKPYKKRKLSIVPEGYSEQISFL